MTDPFLNPQVEASEEAVAGEQRTFTLIVAALGSLAVAAALAAWWWTRNADAVVVQAVAPVKEGQRNVLRLVDFELTERGGRTITRADLTNKFLIVNFVATSCSTACAEVNKQMASIQKFTESQPDVRLLSITVDPRTDTTAVLKKFADRYKADPDRWLYLTGDKDVILDLVEQSFLPTLADEQVAAVGGFAHTDRIVLVDKSGVTRASFNGLRRGVDEAVIAELAKLHLEKPAP